MSSCVDVAEAGPDDRTGEESLHSDIAVQAVYLVPLLCHIPHASDVRGLRRF